MFSSYTAEQIARTYQLADLTAVNLIGAVTWAFLFEDQPYFDGFRDLATNGIDKPVLNVFRMLGQMRGDRVRAESTGWTARGRGPRPQRPRPGRYLRAGHAGRAAPPPCSSGTITTMTCRAPASEVELTLECLPNGRPMLTHYRIDSDHSNSYTAWKAMGSPQAPTPAQYAELERPGNWRLSPPSRVNVVNGRVVVTFTLPRQGVSLIKIVW